MLVGIKPTVGRVSRYGVIPIAADQDNSGPMARTVADAAIMLGALEGGTPDPNDAATSTCMLTAARFHEVPPRRIEKEVSVFRARSTTTPCHTGSADRRAA
jgi:Asp-tRNA(Asn)/Glu-tRNA(Gln) amidotransferase A subunit family amidase